MKSCTRLTLYAVVVRCPIRGKKQWCSCHYMAWITPFEPFSDMHAEMQQYSHRTLYRIPIHTFLNSYTRKSLYS